MKFQALFKYLDEKTTTSPGQYWYYNMETGLTMFFDGTVRTKSGESRKYN